ncbi:hypothetical protein CYR55_05925 [Chimaeribacter californicus]|uniref:Uncharacterized protein n=1 Tax=Chimaeribacter californicus TaxID=2060067 RepID=A0A2N5EE54_9GAMM|nr:hypothetical protein [Chimaeribacter californicus]PLR40814.1 hypothetical protein CYR55_05925 [Chimaeribacter californicus]
MWPIQKVINKKYVSIINKKLWTIYFFMLVSFIFLFYGLMRTLALNEFFYKYWCTISFLLVMTYLSAFSLRCYKYGLDLVHHEAWEKETELIEKKWRAWSSKYLLIVDHQLLLPSQINKIKKLTGEHQRVIKGQEVTFDPSNIKSVTFQTILQELLFSLRGRFQELTPLFDFDVVFIKDSDLTSWDDFKRSWKLMGLPVEKLFGYVFTTDTYHKQFSLLLDNSRKNMIIVISVRLLSESNVQNIGTESGCIFILTHEESVVYDYGFYSGRLFRPLFVDEINISDGLYDFTKYQPISKSAEEFYLSNICEGMCGELASQLNNFFVSENTSSKCQITDLDLTLGNLDVWAAMSLSASCVERDKKIRLIAHGEKNGINFNIVTPCRGYEGASV